MSKCCWASVAVMTAIAAGAGGEPVAERLVSAKSVDGSFISWREHIVDDSAVGRLALSGSDGLTGGDLDRDGYEDFVSVHESDTTYHGKPIGQVRIAWGSEDAGRWELTTLASGIEAAAAEDVDIADANGDGYPDVVVACELAHLVYFENPGVAARSTSWKRIIPPITADRGSYIRVFFADLDADGRPEVVAANKGEQNPDRATPEINNISLFTLPEDPLDGSRWREQVLGKVRIPINSKPVDLDGDGDLDVVGGSRGEARILWFENRGALAFVERRIDIEGPDVGFTGFNMAFADLDDDGRLDILTNGAGGRLLWLRQPDHPDEPWSLSVLGDTAPDALVSITLADIDGDGDLDAFTGTYSWGPRDHDGADIDAAAPIGRIAWFENGGMTEPWPRHDISRRKRGMYDKWLARDLDGDGDFDFIGTRGNSAPYDGVIWLEQVRGPKPRRAFEAARREDSMEMPLPHSPRD